MPKFVTLLASLAGLLLSGTVSAEQITLQVDLLLVEQPSWVRNRDSGEWPLQEIREAEALPPADLATDPAFDWQPGPGSAFSAEAGKLAAQGYKTLYLASFRFPQTRLRNATTWAVSDGDPLTIAAEDPYAVETGVDPAWFDRPTDLAPESLTPISGWLRSWVDTYLFVEFDIARIMADASLRELLGQPAPDWQTNAAPASEFINGSFGNRSAAAESGWSVADVWPREAISMHRINTRKRVKLNEIHYFDHPQIGILIRVTEPSRNATPEETP